jgi:predicted  nucleic acid-binding Zn-ribbon protein
MLRPSDVASLEAMHGRGPAVGEWPHDLVALLAEQNRQLEATQTELRHLERQAVRLEAENTELRSKVRDLQSVLAATWRSMSAAMEESVNVLTMPDTPND